MLKTRWVLCIILIMVFLVVNIPQFIYAVGSFAPSGTTGSMDNPAGFMYRAPSGITSNITGPIPTNDWWTGLLVRNEVQTISPHPLIYSTCTTSYPAEGTGFGLAVHFKGAGYVDTSSLGPLDGVTRTQWNVSSYVQPAFLIWNDLMNKASTTFKLDGYGDWHINLLASDSSNHSMAAVLSSGSPYTYYSFSNGNPKLRMNSWGGFIDYFDASGNAIMTATSSTYTGDRVLFKIKHPVTQEVTTWALFSAPGTVFTRNTEYLSITIGSGANYLVSAILPSQADFALFYNHAYAKVTGTTSSYTYNETTAKIISTFTTTVAMLRDGFSNTTIQSLFPHQYKHLDVGFAVDPNKYYESMRGKMRLFTGNQFRTVLTNHGILSTFNEPTGSSGYSHSNAVTWLNQESNHPMDDQGTPMVNAYNVASYEEGKALFRNANNMDLAYKLGRASLGDQYKTSLYNEFLNWFTYSPGQERTFWADGGPYGFFTYNPPTGGALGRSYGALTPWRAGFGVQAMNDMHFHFGYWIHAASLMAIHHPTFVNDFNWAVDEVIRNIASPNRADPKYPYLRYFSPFKGRSFASGWYWDDNYRGNDMESTSESMNAWQAIYQWGLLTGNNTYRDLGLYLYWTEKSAIDEYWLDVDNENFHPSYPHKLAVIVRENNYEFNVYWGGSHYEELYGIQMLPLHAGMLYLGLNNSYASSYWNAMTASHRSAKGTDFDFWKAEMIKYASMIDHAYALSKFQYNPTRVAHEELLDEDTWSLTYQFIHNMNLLGRPSTDITADKPSYGVFKKGGTYNYVGFNPSATIPLTINFKNASGNTVYTMANIPPRTTIYSNGGPSPTPTVTPTPGATTTPGVTPTATPAPTPTPGVTTTPGVTPTAAPLATTWYLYNNPVSGVSPAGENLQSTTGALTGWQPIRTIGTGGYQWYSPVLSGTYSTGNWSFILWSNNPGSSSIKVELHKVNSNGSGASLIASQTLDAGNSSSGNHSTTYNFSGVGAVSLNNQRLMVKLIKTAGADLTICYNGNDFPSRLLTPSGSGSTPTSTPAATPTPTRAATVTPTPTKPPATVTPTPTRAATATPTPTRAATATPTPAPTGTPLGSTTWYLYNTVVSGVSPAGETLQTTKSGLTGWQPIKTISTTGYYWYGAVQTGTYNAGNWQFILWSNNPGSSSIKVELYKVNSNGSGASLIASQTLDAGNSSSGNHSTTYNFSGVGAVSLSNQRLMIKLTKTAGADLTIAYNTNDFPTRLTTP